LTIRRRADYQNNRRRKQKSRFHGVSLLNVFASNAVWLQRSKSSAVSTGKTSCTFNLLLKEAAGTAAGITGPGAHATEANHRTCYSSLAPSISSGACMKHKLGVVALLLLVSLSAALRAQDANSKPQATPLSGTVFDASGAVIAGATVQLRRANG